jgi:hypothetical protein
MRYVYLIEEDNHGMIGVAKNYSSAIDFLVDSDWLDGTCELYEGDGTYKTIEGDLGKEWKEKILAWDIEIFNKYFDGCFYLTIEEVYGT